MLADERAQRARVVQVAPRRRGAARASPNRPLGAPTSRTAAWTVQPLREQPADEVVAVLARGAGDDGRPGLIGLPHAVSLGPPAATLRAVPVVLFTCAGQRVDIVTAFGRAGATTLAVDANELAPALYAADRRALVPRVDDPGYLDALRALVALHDARLVVPLADLDHMLLAEHRDRRSARSC